MRDNPGVDMLAVVSYSFYVSLLASAAEEIVWRVLFTIFLALFFFVTGLWLPSFLFGRSNGQNGLRYGEPAEDSASAPMLNLALLLCLATGGGVMSSILAWTLSFFLFKSALVGTIGLVVLVVLGLVRCRLVFSTWNVRHEYGPVLAGAFIAGGLGLWQFGGIELSIKDHVIPPDRCVDYTLFTDLHRDVPIHIHIASLMANTGLPRINLYGIPDKPFHPLAHVGYAVLIAGVSQVTRMSLYESCSCLWIVAYWIILWSALGILVRLRISGALVLVGGLSPLVWGGLGVPPFHYLIDASDLNELPKIPFPAGMMYHNFPQVWSISLMSVGLVCLDLFTTNSRQRTRYLAVATFAIVISGWVKPSLFILYVPTVVILLAWNRGKALQWAVFALIVCFGTAVYFLPMLLEHLPTHREWRIAPSLEQTKKVSQLYLLGFGAGFLLLGSRLWSFLLGSDVPRLVNSCDLCLITIAGGGLFAVLFREDRYFPGQVNQLWGPAGCFALCAPFVVGWCANSYELNERAAVNVWLRRAGWIFVVVHLLNGTMYAAIYPLLNLRLIRTSYTDIMADAGQATRPTTRFYIDPLLDDTDLMAYLGRPVTYGVSALDEQELAELWSWRDFAVFGQDAHMRRIAQRDAAILHASRIKARAILPQIGWTMIEKLPEDFELWENNSRNEDSQNYETVTKLPEQGSELTVDNMKKLRRRADELRARGQSDHAIRLYKKVLELYPSDIHIHNVLGNLYSARGDWDEATRYYQNAVEMRPEKPELRYNLGLILQRQGELQQAIDQFRTVLQLKSDLPAVHNSLGLALEANGQLDEAVAHFRRALRVDPDFQSARRNLDRVLGARQEDAGKEVAK